jgi:hypothetical protein
LSKAHGAKARRETRSEEKEMVWLFLESKYPVMGGFCEKYR